MLPSPTTQAAQVHALVGTAMSLTGEWRTLPDLLRVADASFAVAPHDLASAHRHAAFWIAAMAHGAKSRTLALRAEAQMLRAAGYDMMPGGVYTSKEDIARIMAEAIGEIRAAATPESAAAAGQILARLSALAQPTAIDKAQAQDDSVIARLRRAASTAATVALVIVGIGGALGLWYAWTKRHAVTGAIGSIPRRILSAFGRKRNPRLRLRRSA